MGIPQIILTGWYAFSLGVNAVYHGKERTGKYSFWPSLVMQIAVFALLIWGGFYE